ncbi:MAG: hypothetical protein AAGD07_05385 [Planctomycetota bacterium]
MAQRIAINSLLCVTLVSGTVFAQNSLPVDPLDNNAALSYWQAFALLPPIDESARDELASVMRGEAAVSDAMREIVMASEHSLEFLHRGVHIESCAWGLAFELGPYAYLPHLGKARELSRTALMRARIRFKAGQVQEGIDDTLAAIRLGRHVGQDGVIVLINILVGFAIELEAIETIADSLHRLNQQQRDDFEQELNRFPSRFDMKVAIQGERDVFLGWLLREIESGRSRDRIVDLAAESVKPQTIAQIKEASSEQLREWARETGVLYEAVIAAVSKPNETLATAERLEAQIEGQVASNPVTKMFLPAFGSTRLARKRYVTKKAQLSAAFALFRSGASALELEELRDPFGNGPFELHRVDEGVELVSDLKRGDTAVTLRVPGLLQ